MRMKKSCRAWLAARTTSTFSSDIARPVSREDRCFPCKAAVPGQSGRRGDMGTAGTPSKRIDLVGATGFEPATFRSPAERIQAPMCLGASIVSYVSRGVDVLDA